jgi:acyl-CoA synthetase (AMP-forming)/AMP-acid ligase II/acyl carrier protein
MTAARRNPACGSSGAEPPDRFVTLIDILERRAADEPDGIAFWVDDPLPGPPLPITYAALARKVFQQAQQLSSEYGIGDRVVLLFANSMEYLTALLAGQAAGVTMISGLPPFAPRTGPAESLRGQQRLERVRAVIESSDAKGVLGSQDLTDTFRGALSRLGVGASLSWTVPAANDALERNWTGVSASADDIAFVQYTSGSTSLPTGAVVTHASLMANLAAHLEAFRLGPDDVAVGWLPFFHDMGLIGTGLLPIFGGFPCALMSPTRFSESPYRWLQLISELGGTVSWAPNFAYEECATRITENEVGTLDLSAWRVSVNAAEPVDKGTMDRFAARFAPCGYRASAMTPSYGLAEATLIVSAQEVGAAAKSLKLRKHALGEGRAEPASATTPAPDAITVVSCGRPVADVGIRIVDPMTSRPQPDRSVGEVWINGPGIAAGYIGQPERTAATFHARLATGEGPFLRTGDLGFLSDGDLYLSGRLKDVIIVRGVNFHAQDLERTAEVSHPAVRDHAAAAFQVADGESGGVALVCEARRTSDEDAAEAAAAIRRAIVEDWGIAPSVVTIVRTGSVPKTPSGKIQRGLTKTLFLTGKLPVLFEWRMSADDAGAAADSAGPGAAPDLSAWILGQLGVREPHGTVGGHFADLGVDSLRVTRLAAAVERRYGVQVDAAELFEQATVARVTTYLEHIIWRGSRPDSGQADDRDFLTRRLAGRLRLQGQRNARRTAATDAD